jgi:hypothetical protein
MSDMATASNVTDFTVRDLNRQLARVLEACDRVGIIRIRSRKGRTYELRPQPEPEIEKPGYPDFAARRRALGMPKMTKQQRETLDRLIAGE